MLIYKIRVYILTDKPVVSKIKAIKWAKIVQATRRLWPWRQNHHSAVEPVMLMRHQHAISRKQISNNAIKVLYRLKNEGYDSFLVGGGVRDLLLNLAPKDFDIVTNARPEQIRKLFRNCRLIGRRFRLAHVFFDEDIVEVATFRANTPEAIAQHVVGENGMLLRDNVYGDIQQDAVRRDFTVNALYYNIADFSVRDYVNGLQDLKAKHLRLIGNPVERYREDPVRILRAVRLSTKLNFTIHPDTESPIYAHAHLLAQVASGRIYEEFKKMMLSGQAYVNFNKLKNYGLLPYILPLTAESLNQADSANQYEFIHQALANTDIRINENRPVTVGFLLTALLWHPVLAETEKLTQQGLKTPIAFEQACQNIVLKQCKLMSLPRFVSTNIHDILQLQPRLQIIQHPKAFRIIEHSRFKAAYDFLLIRANTHDNLKPLTDWWTEFLNAPPHLRNQLVHTKSRRRKRPSKRKKGPQHLQSTTTHHDEPAK